MHLVILTQYYPPEIGAPQARLSDLARRFASRGHEVTVLTAMPSYPQGRIYPGYGGVLRREAPGADGVRVIRTLTYPTNKLDLAHRLANYFSFVFSAAFFGSFVLGRADYLIVESPPLFLGLAGYWLSRLTRARLIFNVSDLWPDSVVRLGKLRPGSKGHRFSVWLEGFCYRKAWMVTGQSQGILDDIRQRFPGVRQFLVTNGVDPRFFSRDHRSEKLRQDLGGGRQCLVLYTGLHGLAQGLDQVLDAAAGVRDLTDLAIVFVGDGSAKEALQHRAVELKLDNVRFLPAVARPEMPAMAASADVLLAPLATHLPGAVPSKIYEGMGSGVPVLLVAGGEPADIIERTGCGVVVPVGDTPAFVAALRRLAGDPELRQTLGDNGRRAAETTYNRELIVARFIDCLEQEL